MLNIDFGNKRIATNDNNADNKQNSSSKLQDEDKNFLPSSPITSEMESQLLNDTVQQPTSILYEGREDSELIDGMRDDNYVTILNQIDVINEMLQDDNNGDTDAVDILSVRM